MSVHTYDPERGEIKKWICTVVKYFVFDMNRKYARRKNSTSNEYDLSNIADNFTGYDDHRPDNGDYESMFNDEIVGALNELPYIHKEAMLLQLAGYSLNEIADISYKAGNLENKNIHTIGTRLFLARKQMRQLLTNTRKRT